MDTGHHDPCFFVVNTTETFTPPPVHLYSMKTKISNRCPSVAFKFIWGVVGKDVANAVMKRRVVYIPHRGIDKDYSPETAARKLVEEEVAMLARKVTETVGLLETDGSRFTVPSNWVSLCRASCEVLGLKADMAEMFSAAAFIEALDRAAVFKG